MVVAAVVRGLKPALAVRGTAKFAAPDHQRVIKQASLLEIRDEGGSGLVNIAALQAQIAGQVVVLIPAPMVQLDEPHAALGHAAGQQAVRGESAGLAGLRTVGLERGGRFVAHVGQIRHGGLHAEGHFILADACVDFRIDLQPLLLAVEGGQGIELVATHGFAETRRIGQVKHRIAAATECDPLMVRGQKTGTPEAGIKRIGGAGGAAARKQHHKGGQARVLTAQAVAGPGSKTGAARLLVTGLQQGDGRIVVDCLRVHGTDEAQLIHDAGGVRQQFAHPGAAFAVAPEIEQGSRDRQGLLPAGHAREALITTHGRRQFLAVQGAQAGLVIEEIELRRPAMHEQVDDAPGLGRESGRGLCQHAIAEQQRGERRRAQAQARVLKEMAAVHHRLVITSSRLSSVCATLVQAASSLEIPAAVMPMLSNCRAAPASSSKRWRWRLSRPCNRSSSAGCDRRDVVRWNIARRRVSSPPGEFKASAARERAAST